MELTLLYQAQKCWIWKPAHHKHLTSGIYLNLITLLNNISCYTSDYLTGEIQGINTSYIYHGLKSSFFALHTEDYDLCSISYLHRGAPKYSCLIISSLNISIGFGMLSKGKTNKKLKNSAKRDLKQILTFVTIFIRHKSILLSVFGGRKTQWEVLKF